MTAKASLPVLSSVLNAAAHDAALMRQMAGLTLMAVRGFAPGRTGLLAIEARETAAALVASLDVVINACEAECPSEQPAPNVLSIIRRVPVVGVAS